MSTYDFRCTNLECGIEIEDDASMDSFKEHHPSCPDCNSPMNYFWSPTVIQVVLRDGSSGSWPSKGNRFKNYRAKQAEKMAFKQIDRYGHIKRDSVPNYKGQETSSWREARDFAQKEKGPEAASTYDSKVADEISKK